MEADQKSITRKKFVLWGLAILSFLAVLGMRFFPKKKNKMVRMLTEDGRLVEVDEAVLSSHRKKISNAELQTWVKK